MAAYIALLRAVNVGGTGKLPMSDLKAMCENAGFGNVRGLLPVFWSIPNGSLPQRIQSFILSQLITSFIESFRSHSLPNSRGVL
jgi:uncharacterized protein (DUF1697 family)